MPAAIYARQSIEKADSVSIDAQIERCKAICTMNGWKYIIYSDVGFSGKNINRPNFERLLEDIRAGKISALVSYKLDRISRSITDFAQLLQLFEKYEVQYISSTEQFDTSSPVGRAMIYIVMVFAQLERETTTQRVTDNYRYRASRGLYMGGNVPLGYMPKAITLDGRNASVLAVDEPAAQIVRNLFSWYQNGCNTHQIARKLNSTGILTSKHKDFTGNAVLRILRNLTYCCNTPELYEYLLSQGYEVLCGIDVFDGFHGMCCYFKNSDSNKPVSVQNQLVAIGRHEPVISSKLWIAVQRQLNAVKDGSCRPKGSSRSWLAGLVKCAECGHSFGLKYTQKASGEYSYYFCRGRAGRGVSTCPNDLWINTAELEPSIECLVRERAKSMLKCGKSKKNITPTENALSTKLQRECVDCRSRIKNLIDNIGKGNEVIDLHLTEYITELDSKCRSLESEISHIDEIVTSGTSADQNDSLLIEYSKSLSGLLTDADIDEKRQIARTLIKQVTIGRDGNISVEWLI